MFNIKLNLVDISESIESQVNDILDEYSREFNVNLGSVISLIRSTIAKISNVKEVVNISVTYLENGVEVSESIVNKDLHKTYFNISTIITTSEK